MVASPRELPGSVGRADRPTLGSAPSALSRTGCRPAVVIDGARLTCDEVKRVAADGEEVRLGPATAEAVRRSAHALASRAKAGGVIYGLNTGVGALDGERSSTEAEQQKNLIRCHAAGVGDPLPDREVRAMLLCRANTLARGQSGVSPAILDALVALLNRGVIPRVPELGSVGAADLAPLAHAALVLCGEGRARIGGDWMSGQEALTLARIPAPGLAGRDGLALINGLAHSAGTAALAVSAVGPVIAAAEVAVALGMVALQSPMGFVHRRLAKGHLGAEASAARLRDLLAGHAPLSPALREPLSTRCAHHIIGATREVTEAARAVVEIELNAPCDNPLVFADGDCENNCANFDGQRLAQAIDAVQNSLTALAGASERRTARLLDSHRNRGLPAFLCHPKAPAGLHSGLMIVQYTAAAAVAALRAMAPAAGQSIPTCAATEDVVSMSALAARQAMRSVALLERVVAAELLVAAQAVDLSRAALPPGLAPFHWCLRQRVPVQVEDRVVGDDIESVADIVRASAFR